jgi:PAS domain S-box-containing protein
MPEFVRKSGIDVIGEIPWGTHFCQFYQTKQDLITTMIPYFQAGLQNNEFCMWITADKLTSEEIRQAMTKAVKGFSAYIKRGQIEIVPYSEWYLEDGSFDGKRVLVAWEEKLKWALKKGYDGLRFASNNSWLPEKDWCSFAKLGEGLNNVIGNYKMIALCAYSLDQCSAPEIIDVIRNHEFALINRSDKLEIYENSRYKNTKTALIESKKELDYLSSFPALNPMQVLEIDMTGKIKYCNDSTQKLFPDMVAKGVMHPYLVGLLEMVRTHAWGKSNYFSRIVEVNGQVHEQVIYFVAAGNTIRIYGHDISEYKQAQDLLQETGNYLNNLLDYANAPIIVWDTHYRISRFNPAFERLTGYKSRQVLGLGLDILFPEHQKIESLHQINRTLSGERWEAVEIPILRIDGQIRTVLWNSANVYDNDGKQIIATIAQGQDITERIIAEEKVNNLNEILKRRASEAEVANKELEAFSYSVSHDLRAPLRSMEGFSQALLEDCSELLSDAGKDYLKRIQSSAELMAQLIDDMLRLSRITRADMTLDKVNLSEIAQSVSTKIKSNFPKRKIIFMITPGLTARADKNLLSIALENLFENAVKFTGKVPRAIIEFGITEKDGQKAYFVRDKGVGFDMTYANKLFKPFQRLHTVAEFPGNGIGLASVQRIIQRHGGQVWAEGKVGEGAAFYFTLEENKVI